MKLVIYYSLNGSTKKAAEKIAEELGADILNIHTLKKKPKNFASQMFLCGFMSCFGVYPKIKKYKIKPEKYDAVVIGTPIWAGKCAAPLRTVFSRHDFSASKLYFFTSSGSGENKGCVKDFEKRVGKPEAILNLKQDADNSSEIAEFIKTIKG